MRSGPQPAADLQRQRALVHGVEVDARCAAGDQPLAQRRHHVQAEGAPEGVTRRIGLPVKDRESGALRFHVWYPGCPMEDDAYGIPKPKDTEAFEPELLLVPCVGWGPRGLRLGYGGGFYDRTLAGLRPRPFTVGIGFAHGHVPWLQGEPHDVPLDAMLVEDGVVWQRD